MTSREPRSSGVLDWPEPLSLRDHWTLDPAVAFLNHGSFGACPRRVLDEQARLRARMERQPVRFFLRELEPQLDEARACLAAFVGAAAEDLVFVPNATTAVNAVLRSLELAPDDEILITDHGYNACANVAEYVAARSGARLVVARVPFPLRAPAEVTAAIEQRLTARTRIALIDHVTSPTGLVFPIAQIVASLRARGVDVLVDGAHGPGMLPLDLDGLGAAYYTGNCHKWLCAPKGAALLHVRRDRQAGLRPAVISHGANSPRRDKSRFQLEFDWAATDDYTPFLCVPEALRSLAALLPGGWPAVMARNRALALAARRLLCDALAVDAPAPDEMIGALAAVPLPGDAGAPLAPLALDPLQELLFAEHAIEVPVMPGPSSPGRLVRISAQLYNTRAEYEHLAAQLRKLVAA